MERMAKNLMVKKKLFYGTELCLMLPQNSFEKIRKNGTYTILMFSQTQINTDNEFMKSAVVIHREAIIRVNNARSIILYNAI